MKVVSLVSACMQTTLFLARVAELGEFLIIKTGRIIKGMKAVKINA